MDRRSAVAHVLSTAELMGVTLDELAELVQAAKAEIQVPRSISGRSSVL